MRHHAGLEKIDQIDLDGHRNFPKIRQAAAVALKELQLLRSAGPITQEALDAEVERISQQTLRSHGCDLVVQRAGDGISRFMVKIENPKITCDLIKNFFHHHHA